ncbi:hypothetical protein RhiirA5_504156 [Rhizophagus irregularis]|uniref:Uncharacterized protein n=1 Tax=Rhizophagus irregularis TaxID=588596 RepID=A0A2N0P5Z0_9GLOM|nr:hypothetical protein RhiirA5_504156 [Rhizophagus irregularis]
MANVTIISNNYIKSSNETTQPQMENNIDIFLEDDNINIQQEKELFELQCNELEQQLKEIKSQIQSLKQKNKELEKKVGIATNFNSNDDNIIFNNDIIELHDTLENYVTNLKPKIDVNINEVKKLLIKYGCQSKISYKDQNKPLIKAVLQRHVLEEILAQADFYFSRSNNINNIVVYQNMIMTSSDDDNFIHIISKKINRMMNKYRKINDIKRKKYVNSLAKDLVLNVIRIFYFNLLIQEPVIHYHWFNNNEKINKSYMKGSWDEDEIENLVVEICSFPLILKPIYPNGFKVCTPAKVFPFHIMKQNLAENLGTSVGQNIS